MSFYQLCRIVDTPSNERDSLHSFLRQNVLKSIDGQYRFRG
jgi:hypothetical protein